jgi:hypothetical protein
VRARDRVVAQRDSLGEVLATLPDSRRAFSTPRALLNDATNIERAVASSDCATSARRNQPG